MKTLCGFEGYRCPSGKMIRNADRMGEKSPTLIGRVDKASALIAASPDKTSNQTAAAATLSNNFQVFGGRDQA
jgi:hypothetical protein